MKKISAFCCQLFFIVAILFVFSCSVWGKENVTISFASTAQRESQTTKKQVWKNGDVTFTNEGSVANYYNPVRLYKNSTITIEAPGNITKIVATASSNDYATALKNSVGAEASVSGSTVTITPTNTSKTYTATLSSGQVRLNSITITYSTSSGELMQLATPTGLNATDISSNAFTANWTAVENATSYVVTAGSIVKTTTATSCIISGLNHETTYTYTVVAKGDGVTYSDSEAATATVTTKALPTYNVTLYNGDTQYGKVLSGSTVTLPATGPTPGDACTSAGWEFAGWSTTKITEETNSATLLTGTYTPEGDINLYAVYKLEETSSTGATEVWTLTDIANISATDEVVITMKSSGGTIYALSSANGTSDAPVATTVTVSDGVLKATPADGLVWNISTDNGSYTIYPKGTTATWLYCNNSNNGVRVGTEKDKVFVIESSYLKNVGKGRYLGVYVTTPDWRCYTSTSTNIVNQTLGFYKKTGGVETTVTYNSVPICAKPVVQTPTFAPESGKVDGENNFTESFLLTIASTTDDATIYYSTDGVNFNIYTSPITISTTTTIQAYATADGYDQSNTTEVTYTFIETYTVTWHDGASTREETYTDGAKLNIPATEPTSSHDVYNNFVGWTATPSGYSGIVNPNEPTYVSKTTIVDSDMDLYAVFNNASLSTAIVTDVQDLEVGDKIIIAAKDYNYALSITQNDNNRGRTSITKNGNAITYGKDVQVLTLEEGTKDNTFALYTGSGYLYAASSSKNYLRTQTENDANGSWTITIANEAATIKAQGQSTHNVLRYNNNNSLFSCYESGQQDVSIYKLSGTLPTGWTINSTAENGDLFVDANETFIIEEETTVKTLTINASRTTSGQIVANAALTAEGITYVKQIDAERWYFFSLPFDCDLSQVRAVASGGEELEYAPDATNGDYVISYYDQVQAANNAGTAKAWKELLGTNHTLQANRGYIVGYFREGDVTIQFPAKVGHRTIDAVQTKLLDLGRGYEWYTEGKREASNGWNLIGMPYYAKTNNSLNVDMVSIPNADGMTYTQIEYANAEIEPFSSFFVQLEANVAPQFTIERAQTAAPVLRANGVVSKAVISLTDVNGGVDRTTIINNPANTTEYEIGYDLAKWIGYGAIPQIYSIQGDDILAFNSLPVESSTVIALGVYAHADGEYTFALDEKSVGDLQALMLYDNETGVATRLVDGSYTVTLAKGVHEGRFEIRQQPRVATDCGAGVATAIELLVVEGRLTMNNIPEDATIYIYDAVGKMIYVANSVGATLDYPLATKGVYNIVVCSAVERVLLKAIY